MSTVKSAKILHGESQQWMNFTLNAQDEMVSLFNFAPENLRSDFLNLNKDVKYTKNEILKYETDLSRLIQAEMEADEALVNAHLENQKKVDALKSKLVHLKETVTQFKSKR